MLRVIQNRLPLYFRDSKDIRNGSCFSATRLRELGWYRDVASNSCDKIVCQRESQVKSITGSSPVVDSWVRHQYVHELAVSIKRLSCG